MGGLGDHIHKRRPGGLGAYLEPQQSAWPTRPKANAASWYEQLAQALGVPPNISDYRTPEQPILVSAPRRGPSTGPMTLKSQKSDQLEMSDAGGGVGGGGGAGGGGPELCPKMGLSIDGIICLYQCRDGSIIRGKMQAGGYCPWNKMRP
jgi:hypothetical protein